MRTADKILNDVCELKRVNAWDMKHELYQPVLNAINEARKECIEECARVAILKPDDKSYGESILSLIDELK